MSHLSCLCRMFVLQFFRTCDFTFVSSWDWLPRRKDLASSARRRRTVSKNCVVPSRSRVSWARRNKLFWQCSNGCRTFQERFEMSLSASCRAIPVRLVVESVRIVCEGFPANVCLVDQNHDYPRQPSVEYPSGQECTPPPGTRKPKPRTESHNIGPVHSGPLPPCKIVLRAT